MHAHGTSVHESYVGVVALSKAGVDDVALLCLCRDKLEIYSTACWSAADAV